MKTYLVYVEGEEVGTIKAGSQNSAEKKARIKYGGTKRDTSPGGVALGLTRDVNIQVAYTEV